MFKTNYLYNAKVTKIVDGDTIDAMVDLGFTVFVKIRFRLAGLDTAEMNSSDPNLRAEAKKAKQFLVDLILDKDVTIESTELDKYGRWLAIVHLHNGTCINEELISEGLAIPYYGGKR